MRKSSLMCAEFFPPLSLERIRAFLQTAPSSMHSWIVNNSRAIWSRHLWCDYFFANNFFVVSGGVLFYVSLRTVCISFRWFIMQILRFRIVSFWKSKNTLMIFWLRLKRMWKRRRILIVLMIMKRTKVILRRILLMIWIRCGMLALRLSIKNCRRIWRSGWILPSWRIRVRRITGLWRKCCISVSMVMTRRKKLLTIISKGTFLFFSSVFFLLIYIQLVRSNFDSWITLSRDFFKKSILSAFFFVFENSTIYWKRNTYLNFCDVFFFKEISWYANFLILIFWAFFEILKINLLLFRYSELSPHLITCFFINLKLLFFEIFDVWILSQAVFKF